MSASPSSFAWYQKCCMTFPKRVLAEIQLHRAKNIVRHFQIFLRRNSIAPYLKYSKTFLTCVSAENRLHPIQIIFKQFQFMSLPNNNCIVSKLFWGILKLFHDRNSIASDRNYSKNFSNCLVAEIHLQRTEIFVRHLQNVS